MPKKRLSPDLKPDVVEKYTNALLDRMRRVRNLKEELKEETSERKAEIKREELAVRQLEALLAGEDAPQTEIPGTEVPHPRGRRKLEAVEDEG